MSMKIVTWTVYGSIENGFRNTFLFFCFIIFIIIIFLIILEIQ
jgi:hypothetical protein